MNEIKRITPRNMDNVLRSDLLNEEAIKMIDRAIAGETIFIEVAGDCFVRLVPCNGE